MYQKNSSAYCCGIVIATWLHVLVVYGEQNETKVQDSFLNRRYNEVSFLATHNGQSHLESPVQNQTLSLTEQFERGVRATKIHLWHDTDQQGNVVPFVCHGIDKAILDGSYFEKIIEKIPRIFQSWARGVLKEFEPVNSLFQDACKAAYGQGQAKGVIQLKHCILDPSRKPLLATLHEIKRFLDTHPQEIFTLILEDHTNDLDQIAHDFKMSGLDSMVHAQDSDKHWPVINEMINAQKRLVVLLHGDEKLAYEQHPWMHYIWKYAWDTEWAFPDASTLRNAQKDIMPKRGTESYDARHQGLKNKLFIVHHFVTPMAGGSKDGAKRVNKKAFLLSRLERLTKIAGCAPNIVQIDFFDGQDRDALEVINGLNSRGTNL